MCHITYKPGTMVSLQDFWVFTMVPQKKLSSLGIQFLTWCPKTNRFTSDKMSKTFCFAEIFALLCFIAEQSTEFYRLIFDQMTGHTTCLFLQFNRLMHVLCVCQKVIEQEGPRARLSVSPCASRKQSSCNMCDCRGQTFVLGRGLARGENQNDTGIICLATRAGVQLVTVSNSTGFVKWIFLSAFFFGIRPFSFGTESLSSFGFQSWLMSLFN